MEQYSSVSEMLASRLTMEYSASFGSASKLFDASIRGNIYAIYGWARIADEIVDTYRGKDAAQILEEFKIETIQALKRRYSTNPIIHTFAETAHKHGIGLALIEPFLNSMEFDLNFPDKPLTHKQYKTYIYGSAEVVGLMCLKIIANGDKSVYQNLLPHAKALGSAFQKVNFLRDVAHDQVVLNRHYFPSIEAELSEQNVSEIIADIKNDFLVAKSGIDKLPSSSKRAVKLSYAYYDELLKKIERSDTARINSQRIRVGKGMKFWLYIRAYLGLLHV